MAVPPSALQVRLLFLTLQPATYVTRVKSAVTGCISATVNKALANPVVPVPTTTKTDVTDCATPNGDITFQDTYSRRQLPIQYRWRQYLPAFRAGFFGGLSAGPHTPVCRLISSGCESNPAATVNILKPARAGSNKNICQYQPAIMNATALAGAGWTAMAGNPGTTTFVNAASPTTRINGFTTIGTYYYIWEQQAVPIR